MNNAMERLLLVFLLSLDIVILITFIFPVITFYMGPPAPRPSKAIHGMQQLAIAIDGAYYMHGNYSKMQDGLGPEADEVVQSLINEIKANSADGKIIIHPAEPTDSYCAEVLLTKGGKRWCIDSTMFRGYVEQPSCNNFPPYACQQVNEGE